MPRELFCSCSPLRAKSKANCRKMESSYLLSAGKTETVRSVYSFHCHAMSGLNRGQYPSRVLPHCLDALGNIPCMGLGLNQLGLGLNQLDGQLLDGLKGSELFFLECLEIHALIIFMMTRFRAAGYDCVGR